MFHTKVVQQIKTHILYAIIFFYCAIYDITWKKYCRAGQTRDDNMPTHTQATNTHQEYVIFIALPLQQWLHECASMFILYIHCLSCII